MSCKTGDCYACGCGIYRASQGEIHALSVQLPSSSARGWMSEPEVRGLLAFHQWRLVWGTWASGKAVHKVHGMLRRDTAAVASARAGELYGLDALEENIQDNKDNITRFLILSRDPRVQVSPLSDPPQSAHPCLHIKCNSSFDSSSSHLPFCERTARRPRSAFKEEAFSAYGLEWQCFLFKSMHGDCMGW